MLGTPKNIPMNNKKNIENEILINEIIKIDEPFTFITTDKHKSIDGVLSKTADGKLHFKEMFMFFQQQQVTIKK